MTKRMSGCCAPRARPRRCQHAAQKQGLRSACLLAQVGDDGLDRLALFAPRRAEVHNNLRATRQSERGCGAITQLCSPSVSRPPPAPRAAPHRCPPHARSSPRCGAQRRLQPRAGEASTHPPSRQARRQATPCVHASRGRWRPGEQQVRWCCGAAGMDSGRLPASGRARTGAAPLRLFWGGRKLVAGTRLRAPNPSQQRARGVEPELALKPRRASLHFASRKRTRNAGVLFRPPQPSRR